MIAITHASLVREYAGTAIRTLTINTYSGNVTIQRGDSNRLIITMTKHVEGKGSVQSNVAAENQVRLKADLSRSDLDVVARSTRPESGPLRTFVDIEISLPKRLDVTIHDLSSNIRITAPLDRLDLQTMSGTATVRGAVRSIRAWSASGLLSVRQTGPAARFFQRANLRSASGAIAFTASALSPSAKVEAESMSGVVRMKIEGGALPNASATSVSGSAHILYPAYFSKAKRSPQNGARLVAHTVSGSVIVDLSKCAHR